MQQSSDDSTRDWEDDTTRLSTGYADAFEAAWFLTRSPLWRAVRHPTWGPYALGVVLAVLIVAMVLLGPSTDSHFIYTDF
jgi:hypothetical protein